MLLYYCLFVFAPLNCQAQFLWPVLNSLPLPQSFRAHEGSSVNLTCGRIESGEAPFSIQWRKNGERLPAATLANFSDLHLPITLEIRSAQRSDAAAYRCVVQNGHGTVVSSAVNLLVDYLGNFAAGASDQRFDIPSNYYHVIAPPDLDAHALDSIVWRWRKNGRELSPNASNYVTMDGKLVLLNLNRLETASYVVQAFHPSLNKSLTSPVGTLVTVSPSSEKYDTLEIVVAPQDQLFVQDEAESKNLILECVAFHSLPDKIRISWSHNDTLVRTNGDSKILIQNENRRLVIPEPDRSLHNGVYACEVTIFGSLDFRERREAFVEIAVAPINHSPRPGVITVGKDTKFELPCLVEAAPQPKIHWFLNGKSVANDSNLCCGPEMEFRISSAGSLVINRFREFLAGIYQCDAENAAGVSSVSTFYLENRYSGVSRDSVVPIVTKIISNITVDSGSQVRIPCVLKNVDPIWFLSESQLPIDNLDYRLENDGSLIVSFVDESKSGLYSCAAKQQPGSILNRVFVKISEKLVITKGPDDRSVVIGSNVVFDCEVLAPKDEQFSRQWLFRDKVIAATSSRNMEQTDRGQLIVRQVGPNNIGAYTCRVKSTSGVQQQSGHLKIIEKPGMPLHVKAKLINDTLPAKVEVSWAEGFDGNSPIIKYQVEQRSLGSQSTWSDWEVVVENVAREQHVVLMDNLKPSANYEFRVTAHNRFGAGLASVASNNLVMPQQPPAAAPRSVAASARSSQTIMVQWQPPPPEQWNGDILGYVLRYRLANYPDIPWITVNVTDPRSRNHLLDELITWREYEIQVAAFNERGKGVFSRALCVTTLEGVPADHPSDVAVEVLNSTSISLGFVPPPQQMIPGVNLGYKAEFWKNNHNATPELKKSVKVLPYSLFKIDKVISGLEKYVAYNVTVLCYTAQGDGPKSVPVSFRTLQDLPDAVKNLALHDIMFDSAKLVWDQPANPNGVLTNYTLTYWSVNETDSKRTILVAPDSSFYRIIGLTASTKYMIQFFANTQVGAGPVRLLSLESGVPPELPGAPTALTIANVQCRSVVLQFTPGFDGKTLISAWIVHALTGLSTNWTELHRVSAPEAKSVKIDNLAPFTDYRFRIVAENVKGQSAPSAPTDKLQTLQDVPERIADDFEAQPASSTKVKVNWTPLRLQAWNGISRGYEIRYRRHDERESQRLADEKIVFINDTMSSEFEIDQLERNTFYEIEMLAVGEIGRGLPTEKRSVKTYEHAPATSPLNFQVKALKPREVKLAWSKLSVSQANGNVALYRIELLSANSNISKMYHLNSETNFVTIYDLTPFTKYQAELSAATVAGFGPETKTEFLTQEDVPTPPSELVFPHITDSELSLTWKPPSWPNGIILHYSVAYWISNENSKHVVKTTLNADLRMFVATGISRHVEYTFAVAAETRSGFGPAAFARVKATSPRSVPGAPSRPTKSLLRPPDSDSITCEFLHDSHPGNRFFVVEYHQVDVQQWTVAAERANGSAKSFVVVTLKPNTAYIFRLKCVNDFGESRYSLESDWITTAAAPPLLAPIQLSVRAVNASSASLSFQAPPVESWRADSVGYRVTFRQYDTTLHNRSSNATNLDGVIEIPMAGPGTSARRDVHLSGLKQFNHYVAWMQTFNVQGSSSASEGVFFYVGHSLPKSRVKNAQIRVLSSTLINLQWLKWMDEPINGYKIRYKPLDIPDRPEKVDVIPSAASGFNLTDLLKFTTYSISIGCFNRAGQGPLTSFDARTLADVPGPVENVHFLDVDLDSLTVAWTAPLEPNGPLLGYVVVYRTFKMAGEYIKQIQEKTTRIYLPVANLEENTTLLFTVHAETAIGFGPPVNATVTVGPQPGSPSAPSQPSVLPIETSVTLTWRPPDRAGQSPITSYIVQDLVQSRRSSLGSDTAARKKRDAFASSLSAEGGGGMSRWATVTTIEDGGATSYVLPFAQLRANALHRFRLVAKNKQGVSFPSRASEPVLVPESADEQPFYLQWWFLGMLSLVSLVVIVVVVAVLYVTGRDAKFAYERSSSVNSLNLIDAGVMTYEMRANNQHHPTAKIPKKPTTNNVSSLLSHSVNAVSTNPNAYSQRPPLFDIDRGFIVQHTEQGSCRKLSDPKEEKRDSKSKMPSFYEMLSADRCLAETLVADQPAVSQRRSRCSSRSEFESDAVDGLRNSVATEPEVSSIVQHYQTSSDDAHLRHTWRQAVKAQRYHEAAAPSSPRLNASTPVQQAPGFSSFV